MIFAPQYTSPRLGRNETMNRFERSVRSPMIFTVWPTGYRVPIFEILERRGLEDDGRERNPVDSMATDFIPSLAKAGHQCVPGLLAHRRQRSGTNPAVSISETRRSGSMGHHRPIALLAAVDARMCCGAMQISTIAWRFVQISWNNWRQAPNSIDVAPSLFCRAFHQVETLPISPNRSAPRMAFDIRLTKVGSSFLTPCQPDSRSAYDPALNSAIAGSGSPGEECPGRQPETCGKRLGWGTWKFAGRRRDAQVPARTVPRLTSFARRMLIIKRIVTVQENPALPAFMNCSLTRTDLHSHRMVYVGNLAPCGGGAEFLSTLIAWADANREVSVEIMWLGEGDLLGILQAQPVPSNLNQTFARSPSSDGFVTLLAKCGILVMPSLSDLRSCLISEAMAAGLPVLGRLILSTKEKCGLHWTPP